MGGCAMVRPGLFPNNARTDHPLIPDKATTRRLDPMNLTDREMLDVIHLYMSDFAAPPMVTGQDVTRQDAELNWQCYLAVNLLRKVEN